MKKKKKSKKKDFGLIVIIIILGVIILFTPVHDIIHYSDYYINNNNYKKTNGSVFSKRDTTTHGRHVTTHRTYYTFRYIINGKVYYNESYIWGGSTELKINSKEIIYYNIKNPNKVYSKFDLNNKFRNIIYMVSYFVIYTMFIVFLLIITTIKK